MGDLKKHRKKYTPPRHPWIKSRITEEKDLKNEYGLGNNTELWKMQEVLTKAKAQAKNLVVQTGEQAEKERSFLIKRMIKLGFLQEGQKTDDILFLTQRDILDRRLQSILFKKALANSPKQARQFITHEHITVNGKVITSPSYLISIEEELTISFRTNSAFVDPMHPERNVEKQKQEQKERDSLAEDAKLESSKDSKKIEKSDNSKKNVEVNK